eukprot:161312-Amphidinium_carterae.1
MSRQLLRGQSDTRIFIARFWDVDAIDRFEFTCLRLKEQSDKTGIEDKHPSKTSGRSLVESPPTQTNMKYIGAKIQESYTR